MSTLGSLSLSLLLMKTEKLKNKAQVIFSKIPLEFLALSVLQGSVLEKKYKAALEG